MIFSKILKKFILFFIFFSLNATAAKEVLDKIAVIVETLTDNKNRTASNIRTIFQKYGGGLGTQGSASHNFLQLGVIKINKEEIDEEKVFNLATDAGANDCIFHENYYEIHTLSLIHI